MLRAGTLQHARPRAAFPDHSKAGRPLALHQAAGRTRVLPWTPYPGLEEDKHPPDMAKPIFVLNGPNLNMLGTREPAIYGSETLAGLKARCDAAAKAHGLAIDFRQSNSEGELVTWIQEARAKAQGVILNAGAYTHTSVALLDALQAAELPVVEVHLSNIFRREDFRQHSYVSLGATGVICGLGPKGYELAIEAMAGLVKASAKA